MKQMIMVNTPQPVPLYCMIPCFAKHNGRIHCELRGRGAHSQVAGGLEITCRLKFTGS